MQLFTDQIDAAAATTEATTTTATTTPSPDDGMILNFLKLQIRYVTGDAQSCDLGRTLPIRLFMFPRYSKRCMRSDFYMMGYQQ